jgi:hypothetical protein
VTKIIENKTWLLLGTTQAKRCFAIYVSQVTMEKGIIEPNINSWVSSLETKL